MKLIVALCFCMGPVASLQAAEMAYTVRPTELKAKPFSDAATLLTLADHGKVEIITRQSAWMQVKTDSATGWVKMLSLRMADTPKKSGDGGLGALFNVATTGNSGSTVVTGVRGLSEEKLRDAHPNPQALQTMKGYAASKQEGVKFAKSGKLESQQMDYLPASGKGGN